MQAPWWQTAVIYEIYPRSFQDTNGDGIGDLKGIIQRLDYLNDGTTNSLGIDAIWITPFYPSPLHDFGYDVQDYCGVDPLFGTMEDFRELVDKAHQRGIKVIIDLVFNHTSHLHPWFQESRAVKNSPKRDWYIWHNPKKNKKKPNNWQGFFGGSAWTFDSATKQYYLHSFLPQQPDLNWRNRDVREALFNVVRFWIDQGVDGFRLDVINLISKDQKFRSNPLCLGKRPYEMQRHIYDRNQPEIHQYLREFRQVVDSYGDKMLVGEIALDKGEDSKIAAAYYGNENDQLHLAFNFEFLNCPWNGQAFKKAVALWEQVLPPGGWPNYVLSNHDVPRHFSRYRKGGNAKQKAKLAAMMLLTLRGTPFLYYGEEIGMRNVFIPRWRFQDPVGKHYWPFHPGRDEERTPMQWDETKNAGFSTARSWLPVARDWSQVNVEAQNRDENSILAFYKKMIWLRKATPTLQLGDYQAVETSDEHCFAYLRQKDGEKFLVVLNFSPRSLEINLHLELPRRGELLISTLGQVEDRVLLKPLHLQGNEGRLIKLNSPI